MFGKIQKLPICELANTLIIIINEININHR